MLHHRKRADTSLAHRVRHRVFAVGGSLAAAALALGTFAGTAGATPVIHLTAPSVNSILIGQGSATTYNMMQGLDELFNRVPGCDITTSSIANTPGGSHQQLNGSCLTTTTSHHVVQQVPGYSYLDNPVNDEAVEESPIGSSNGVAALEQLRGNSGKGSANSTEFISPINFARSSRTLSGSKDAHGLNFVAYAKDGVAPFYFTEEGGTKNPEAKAIAKLTKTELAKIWEGTIYDWGQLPTAKVSEPIYVYSAQTGSGTQATWQTFLDTVIGGGSSFNPTTETDLVNCNDPVAPNTTVHATKTVKGKKTVGTFTKTTAGTIKPKTVTASTCRGPTDIFENEAASIFKNATSKTETTRAKAWSTANGGASPVANELFFYSYGKFSEQCAGLKEKVSYADGSSSVPANYKKDTFCGSAPVPTGDKVALAPITGKVATPATVVNGTFPAIRYVNNVYSNGNNPNIPKATAATLNYVSEVGFICKPQTVTGGAGVIPTSIYTQPAATTAKDITDPSSGLWYHDEIFATILSNGFIPLGATVSAGKFGTIKDGAPFLENTAGVVHTAYKLLNTSGYGATYLMSGTNHSISSSSNPLGYCFIHTTTGDTAGT
jgi:ABC-type phosphate transport system substrate-binding protein